MGLKQIGRRHMHRPVIFPLFAQGEFEEQLARLHEQSRSRDEEISGGWYLEERLEKDLGWGKCLGTGFEIFVPFV